MQQIYDLIIIGGGPGGIGAAVEAKILGLEKILLIEKGDNHSQTIRKFYKDNKRVDKDYKGQIIELAGNIDFKDGTKESTLNYFDSLLDNEEIDTAFNSEVEKIKKDGDIFHVITDKAGYSSKNIIIAIGTMGKPNKPSYKIPPSIRDRVNFNLDKCTQGEKLEYNGQEKLRLRMGTDIISLENDNGHVKVNFTDGYYTIYDRVIYAIGGTTPVDFLKKCGVTFDENNKPLFDENFETETKGCT